MAIIAFMMRLEHRRRIPLLAAAQKPLDQRGVSLKSACPN
jgi:hypothetical protein